MNTEEGWKEKRQKQCHEALIEESRLCSAPQATYKLLLNRAETSILGGVPAHFRLRRITPWIRAMTGTVRHMMQVIFPLLLLPSNSFISMYHCSNSATAGRKIFVSFVQSQSVANNQNARNPCHSPDQQVRKGRPKLLINQYHNQLFRPCLSFASSSLLLLPQFLGLLQPQLPV